MIAFRNVTFGYGTTPHFFLESLDIGKGEFVLVQGPTGSGKSTFLKLINGLAPHFTGGRQTGNITLDGQRITGQLPHELADQIGFVNQQPEVAFVTDTVEEELVFGMEQLGLSAAQMRVRLDEISRLLALSDKLEMNLSELSAGWQQRVAIGSALAAGQRILLLDEPTSALDNLGADELLDLLSALSSDHGITIIVAEHQTERFAGRADRILECTLAGNLIEVPNSGKKYAERWPPKPRIAPATKDLMVAKALTREFAHSFTLGPIDLVVRTHSITGFSGLNGSGKTSLLWSIYDEAKRAAISTAFVPSNAGDLLILNRVGAELDDRDKLLWRDWLTPSEVFEKLTHSVDPNTNPRDLSVGQQLALALAIQLTREADIVLLDEPTRGLDIYARIELARLLQSLRNQGAAIAIATHDRAFIESLADHTFELTNGQVAESVAHNE